MAQAWWQRGIIYQVYPRSFMDASGDGVGDLAGITGRLGYLKWLGVDALWLSPIYPSPMLDFGYDVTDYMGVDPLFGSLADFDGLVAEAHRLGLRVIMDYIPNHTSSLHPWFVESRSSRDNPRRDWYIWRDPAAGGPPNNWLSVFGGSAWALDATTGQYYYHAYLPQQPDLNWRNPAVQAAMLDVLRFWLEHGVDGFRIDALRQLIKDDQWRDNPPDPAYRPGLPPYASLLPTYTTDRPEIHAMIGKMRCVVDEYSHSRGGGERILIGELYLPIARLVTYYGENGQGLQLPFNFHLISLPFFVWPGRTLAMNGEAFLRSMVFEITRYERVHEYPGSLFAYWKVPGSEARLPVLILLLLVYGLSIKRRVRQFAGSLLAMAVFVNFNPVLFPQYFSWLAPFVPLVLLELKQAAAVPGVVPEAPTETGGSRIRRPARAGHPVTSPRAVTAGDRPS